MSNITKSGVKKIRSSMNLPPVEIPNFSLYTGEDNVLMKSFVDATTADEQLSILKKILDKEKESVNRTIVKLLVVAFFHSEAKHPVKCFLARHVTKSGHLQEPFTEELTSEISLLLKKPMYFYDEETFSIYKDVISKVSMCIENFPAGTEAVRNVYKELAMYLAVCLHQCASGSFCRLQSPMKKNEIYDLAHLTLRLLQHLIRKYRLKGPRLNDEDDEDWLHRIVHIGKVELSIQGLLEDGDVPMDTKCLCGILMLSLEATWWNRDYWKFLLVPAEDSSTDDHVRVAKCFALVTTVPMARLGETVSNEDEHPAILILVTKLLDIAERGASDAAISLCVTRALHHVSKGLTQLPQDLGVLVMEKVCMFVWTHLDHFMDSVRHLTGQTLTCIVQYCARLETADEGAALQRVVSALRAAGAGRRALYAGARGAARGLPVARVLRHLAPLAEALPALREPHLASTVAATLDELLKKHSQETEPIVIYQEWVVPILAFVQSAPLEAEVLAVLEKLLATAAGLNPGLAALLLPHVRQACEAPQHLEGVLALLSVCGASIADGKEEQNPGAVDQNSKRRGDEKPGELWRGIIPFHILNEAVVHADDEIRLRALALTCAGKGAVSAGECDVALRFLRYNIEAQSPHFRQRALALLKKFYKRVEDGCRAAKRQGHAATQREQYYRSFLATTWRQCFDSLLPLANYGRRSVALSLLQLLAHPTDRLWSAEYVEKLLLALEDSYETNKAIALDILQHCPLHLLQDERYSVSLELADIVRQASSVRPAECVSAAYKLRLLYSRRAGGLLRGLPCEAKEPAMFTILSEVVRAIGASGPLGQEALYAPRDNPNYGLLHCMCHLLTVLPVQSIVDDLRWIALLKEILKQCALLLEQCEAVVCSAAPEGIMPADATYTDYGNNAGVELEDGQLVTAQMVLLVAWRTVKEACMTVAVIGSRVRGAALPPHQLAELERLLARVVCSARHRGAFEVASQAYEMLLRSIWRDPAAQHIARARLQRTLQWLRAASAFATPADRRSAGLPFFIQALVCSDGSGEALGEVMGVLLERARAPAPAPSPAPAPGASPAPAPGAASAARAHALNVLRALFRAASLDTAVQCYVGEGLCVALEGYDGTTWEERNSSTLLLSALLTRVFGVPRGAPGVTRMTGRVFFTRYPRLYDLMLNKLKTVSASESALLCPSLFPVLSLLARLYPSSLEGTESNIKLVSFIPWVVRCARARVLTARRLAAAAGAALVSPHRYIEHLVYLFGLISEPRVERNFCHGILLQVCALLEERPEGLDAGPLRAAVRGTVWVCEQARGTLPCYPVLHQYVIAIRALLNKFPETLEADFLDEVKEHLLEVVFGPAPPAPPPGRELCLRDCLELLLDQGHRDPPGKPALAIPELIIRALTHSAYEVSDAAVEWLLRLHTSPAAGAAALRGVRARPDYLPALCAPLADAALWWTHPERALQHLRLLVAQPGTQRLVLELETPLCGRRLPSGGGEVAGLARLLRGAPARVLPLALASLADCLARQDPITIDDDLANAMSEVRELSLPGGATEVRTAAATLLQRCAAPILAQTALLDDDLSLCVETYIACALCLLLHDEEAAVRALAAAACPALVAARPPPAPAPECRWPVVPALCRERVLRACAARRGAALLTALALQRTAPAPPAPPAAARPPEFRVFDENEKSNVYMEETVIARECGALIAAACGARAEARVRHALRPGGAGRAGGAGGVAAANGRAFLKLADGEHVAADPKVAVFLTALRGPDTDTNSKISSAMCDD